ncbi:MAG: PEP-CTERM sorting domain-containing protein [Pirellulaceae bacterium]|nr:PEP-CTERM sorting domain-containing protein [Planctomycetales bacterium]
MLQCYYFSQSAIQRVVIAGLVLMATSLTNIYAANFNWDDEGGSADKNWSNFGNWSPDGLPGVGDDVWIGSFLAAHNDTVIADSASISIASLSISNGADLDTNGFQVIVNGHTSLSDSGSYLFVDPNASGAVLDSFDTNTLTVGASATVSMSGGRIEVDGGSSSSGLFLVETGGLVAGNGAIDLDKPDSELSGITGLYRNNGTLSVGATGLILIGNPPATTLTIDAPFAPINGRFDMDGSTGEGIVSVGQNATLDIDLPLLDAVNGTVNLASGATLDIESGWTLTENSLHTGKINVNSGAYIISPGIPPFIPPITGRGVPAKLTGGTFTMSGGEIELDETDETLIFDAQFTQSGGVINNSGHIQFDQLTNINSTAVLNMNGDSASMTVNATVNIDMPTFNLDGSGNLTNVTTINDNGNLDLDLGVGADENFNHVININGGELDVTTVDNEWSLTSSGQINVGGTTISTINGETMRVFGDINVATDANLTINAATIWESTASLDIDAGGEVNLGTATYAGAGTVFTGAGTLRKGTATVDADTVLGVSTVVLDDGGLDILNARLTINADKISTAANDGYDGDMTINDGGSLNVNLTGNATWSYDSGTLTYNGNNSRDVFLDGNSPVNFAATMQVVGAGQIDSLLVLTGTTNVTNAGDSVRLNGGDLANTNTIQGGAVNGAGTLQLASGRALRGFGSIGAQIDGDGNSELIAQNGTLTVSGNLLDIGTIGTSGAAGVLNVTSPWNTNVTQDVTLNNGVIQGSTITNDGANGIHGHGTVASRVVNNSKIEATGGGTLVLDNSANAWHGTGAGVLRATSADLELHDNASYLFTGTVHAQAGHTVSANGFELEFDPGSRLQLSKGVYHSTHATDFGGNMQIDPGPSTLKVRGTFEAGSNTNIDGDLQLADDTVVQSGAAFSGGGNLINSLGNALRLADGANVGVTIINDGKMLIGNSPGRADANDYQQNADGSLNVELAGTGLNDFDRLVVSGAAALDGTLNVNLLSGFNPALGDTFPIISGLGGVLGTFATTAFPALDPGLAWDITYDPTLVSLSVIEVASLLGDYNGNGAVDAADYTIWKDSFGTTVTAGMGADGNGNGVIDAADYTVWKDNFGNTAGLPAAMISTSPVPEPSTLVLMLFSGIGLVRRRK